MIRGKVIHKAVLGHLGTPQGVIERDASNNFVAG